MRSLLNLRIWSSIRGVLTALELIASELSQIREALVRLSPPIPAQPYREPYIATVKDIKTPDHNELTSVRDAVVSFADQTNTIVNSEAFILAMIEAEDSTASQYGEEHVDRLPWNKAGRYIPNRQKYKAQIEHRKKVQAGLRKTDQSPED